MYKTNSINNVLGYEMKCTYNALIDAQSYVTKYTFNVIGPLLEPWSWWFSIFFFFFYNLDDDLLSF